MQTLALFTERVRAQASSIPEQDGINKLEMNNIIQAAVLSVRALLGRLVDQWYSTSTSVSESGGSIDISNLDIADISRISLYDSLYGAIPLVNDAQFDTLKMIYTGTTLQADQLYGRITSLVGSGLSIQIVRGANKTTMGTLTLTYPRNPIKAVQYSDRIDLPETFVPAAEDVATLMVFRRLGKIPPADIDRRVLAFIQLATAK